MTARFGLELTPSRCSLVRAQPDRDGVRVLAFDTIAVGSADRSELKSALKPRLSATRYPESVHAVVWGARSVCLTVAIDERPGVDPQAAALEAVANAVPEFRSWSNDAWLHLSLTSPDEEGRRLALVVAASGRDLRRLARPLEKAGLRIGQISTPAMALALLSSFRRGDLPAVVTAYLALNHDGGCVAVERDGRLLYAADLPWGGRPQGGQSANPLLERYAFVAHLAPGLRRVFDIVRRTYGCVIGHVVTCGDLPELRSFTMPLIEELDIEVETLDSLTGIDVGHLPEPRDVFSDQIAGLRLAWTVAAAEPVMELAPVARQATRVAPAVVWGVGGLGAAAAVFAAVALWPNPPESPLQRTSARRADASAVASVARALEPAVTVASGAEVVPSEGAGKDDPPPAPGESVTSAAPTSSVGRLPVPTSTSTSLREAPDATEQPAGRTKSQSPPGGAARVPFAAAEQQAAASTIVQARTVMAETARFDGRRPAETPRRLVREPVVASILYSLESRLAVVDGRVVGIGDSVGDATVVDITRDEVVVRLPSGAARRWPMRSVGGPRERE